MLFFCKIQIMLLTLLISTAFPNKLAVYLVLWVRWPMRDEDVKKQQNTHCIMHATCQSHCQLPQNGNLKLCDDLVPIENLDILSSKKISVSASNTSVGMHALVWLPNCPSISLEGLLLFSHFTQFSHLILAQTI